MRCMYAQLTALASAPSTSHAQIFIDPFRKSNRDTNGPRPPASGGGPFTMLFSGRFCADLFKQAVCDLDHLIVNHAIFRDRLFQRDRDNLVRPQRRHASEFAAVHHVDRAQAITGCQHAIKYGRQPSALNVAQHDGTRLKFGAGFNFPRQDVCNAAKLGMPKLVLAHIVNYWSTRTGCELCTLGHDDDGEVSSALMAMADRLSHFFDIKWPLGNQDDIGSAGNPA